MRNLKEYLKEEKFTIAAYAIDVVLVSVFVEFVETLPNWICNF